MLQYSTIEDKTLELLKNLMLDDALTQFNLAGGTSLALQIGHRKSIDLDMFSKEDFDFQDLRRYMIEKYAFLERYSGNQTLIGTIDGIKVDFIAHRYPNIEQVQIIDGIRLYSLQDISAMKLNAITGSGQRVKDFIDIAYLSCHFSLMQMLDFYGNKYKANIFNAVKSLFYYEDINFDEVVLMLNSSVQWNNIEQRLSDMKENGNKVFQELPITVKKKHSLSKTWISKPVDPEKSKSKRMTM